MPWTAAACLIGCLAISAIPPLNGFISEWYTRQSLFSLSRVEAVALQLAGPYCYGNAGSHWWAGSNVLRQNLRYYFLWCAAQHTR
ncbi:proton-conducting transporter membrane subunit [Escherichia coli]